MRKVSIGKLFCKIGICGGDFTKGRIKFMQQIRSMGINGQIIFCLTDSGNRNHAIIAVYIVISVHSGIYLAGVKVPVTGIVSTVGYNVNLMVSFIIPLVQHVLHNSIAVDTNGTVHKAGNSSGGQRTIGINVNVIIFQPHGIIREEKLFQTFRSLGYSCHNVNFPIKELLEHSVPVTIYVVVIPVGIVGNLLEIIVGKS